MTDQEGQPAPEELASSQPEGQPAASPEEPGAGAAAPEAGPSEQPGEEMVPLSEVQKRLSGQQSAFQRKVDSQGQELQEVRAALEQQRQMYEAIATKDMTADERKRYDYEKGLAELQEGKRELQSWQQQLEEREGLREWRHWYADLGVPREKLDSANTYEEIQEAAKQYLEAALKQPPATASPAPQPSGPDAGDKVHTGTGASAPGTEFEEAMAEGIAPWSDKWKSLRYKIRREKRIV